MVSFVGSDFAQLLAGMVFFIAVALRPASGKLLADQELLSPSQIRAAMQSERSKLASGNFVANGSSRGTALGKVEKSTKFTWKYEFDLASKSFLFDRLESVPANPDTRRSDSELLRIFLCEDAESRYSYEDYIVPIAYLYKHSVNDLTKDLGHRFKRLNVAGLGFCNLDPFLELTQKGDRLFFEQEIAPSIVGGDQVERESQGIVRLWNEFGSGGNVWKFCLWVDTKRGFTPIRIVSYLNDQVELDSSTDWAFVDSVWVPTRLSGRSSTPFLPEGREFTEENIEFRTTEFEMEISWSDVNTFVGPKVYDYKEFQFAKGTQVVEAGTTVHVYGHELPSAPEEPPSRRSNTYLFAMSLIAGVLVLVFGVRFMRAKN
jgi:hypothetical protein